TYVGKESDFPDALVAYAIVKALQELDFPGLDSQYKDRLLRAIERLVPEEPDWNLITIAEDPSSGGADDREKAWALIKEYGELAVKEDRVEKPVRLAETGFWNLLQHYLGPDFGNEAFLLVHDACGYESIVGNWSAAEAVKWFVDDFSKEQR